MDAKLLLVHALSPLHAGAGQGVGVIDLPIAREKATQIPFLPGSTLKGVFRDACGENDTCTRVFGPSTQKADEHAGAVTFTDARLLLLPVRSLCGVFAWVTSPLLLQRLVRDSRDVSNLALPMPGPIAEPVKDGTCLIAEQGCLLTLAPAEERIVLEDLPLQYQASAEASAWAGWLGKALFPRPNQEDEEWQQSLAGRLCIVSDDVLAFLLETATEITARIRLKDDTKTVAQSALWYEESLPTESVLSGLVVAATVRAKPGEVFQTIGSLTAKTLQFGGDATVGRGLCQATLV